MSKSGANRCALATTSAPQKRQKATTKRSTYEGVPSAATVPDASKRRGRQASNHPLPHSELPDANNSEAIGREETVHPPPRQKGAKTATPTMGYALSSDESGAEWTANARRLAPQRRTGSADKSQAKPSVNSTVVLPEQQEGDRPPADLEQACLRLSELQKVRLFCIISQSRIDRSMQSAIARAIGYDPEAAESDRKAVFKKASAIIKAVEKGESFDRLPVGDPRSEMLWSLLPLIPISAQSRIIWDEKRETVEKEMRKLSQTLPVFEWVRENAKGIGDLGLARIIGEAPLIGVYVTHEKLWKRLGLAVISGERQQKKTDKDGALIHGYAPRRRAEAWSVCSDSMFRQQWRGKNPDDPEGQGYAIGPYGAVYAARKAHTLSKIAETEELPFTDRRKWTKKRCDADARRVMTKEFLRDLWRVWHGQEARHPARFTAAKAA
jgi:hypothetical protein